MVHVTGFFMPKFFLFLFSAIFLFGQQITPVRIHYSGGGDWYGNKTTWINILNKAGNELQINTSKREIALKLEESNFKNYPIAYIAGHGNISFNDKEVKILRDYLVSGGFLFADDDYGMDKSFRREMKKVFPELKFTEIPFSHDIYNIVYSFPNGLPKIHEHDGGPPKGLGLFYGGRLICFYSLNTDISDGCEDLEIHNLSAEKHNQALRIAVNILVYAIMN